MHEAFLDSSRLITTQLFEDLTHPARSAKGEGFGSARGGGGESGGHLKSGGSFRNGQSSVPMENKMFEVAIPDGLQIRKPQTGGLPFGV